MKKVELTLGCILRDEGHHIAEWLTFHHLVGFDRFVCVLHQCVDNTEEQIRLVKEKLGLDIYIHHCKSTDRKVQMGTYRWICEKYGRFTKWLLFLDGDEYVYCTNPSVTYRNDIKDYLRTFTSASAISCCAKVFGSNGYITRPDYRLSAYTSRLPLTHYSNRAIKTFIRPNKLVQVISPHYQQVTGRHILFNGNSVTVLDGWRIKSPIWEPICFNHYYTGSAEDWVARYKRGSCNDLRPNQAYSIDEFMYHTQEVEYDDAILRYRHWHSGLMEALQ